MIFTRVSRRVKTRGAGDAEKKLQALLLCALCVKLIDLNTQAGKIVINNISVLKSNSFGGIF
jgi:hypothetical protein